jgi:hypothetical protein
MTHGQEPDRRDGEVPRLPRGPLVRLSATHVFRIGMIGILLIAVIGLRKPCADGMASFIGNFAPPPDAAPAPPTMQLERLTEEEIRRRFPGGEADGGPAEPPAAGRPEVAP